MAQNTHWTDDTMRPSGNGGATILAVIAVIILAALVYLAVHGLGPATGTSTGSTSAPAVSTTAPSVVAPNPAAPAAPAVQPPPAATSAPATTTP